jgi:hypothetical protein
MVKNITTIKLEQETKKRLEKLKENKNESFNDILKKILFILNTVRTEPEKSKKILEVIDKRRKMNFSVKKEKKTDS